MNCILLRATEQHSIVVKAIQENKTSGLQVERHQYVNELGNDLYNVVGEFDNARFSIWLLATEIKELHLTLSQHLYVYNVKRTELIQERIIQALNESHLRISQMISILQYPILSTDYRVVNLITRRRLIHRFNINIDRWIRELRRIESHTY